MIPASLILVMGLALILFGVQNFLDTKKQKIPSEIIKGAIMLVGGLYLVFFLSGQFSKGNNTYGQGLGPPGY